MTAEAKTKVYGDNDPEKFTYLTDVELVSGDDFTGSLTRENTSKAVGTYAITQGSLALSSNYTIIFTGADFKITPKPITVTADAKSKVYGEADPPLTYQVIGTLESGDVFTGALSRDAGSNVGEYAITKDNLALNANYSITFVAAKLTVTAADLTVTAADKSKVYGSDDPALTYDVTGFKLTDTKESVMTGALSRVAGENVSAVGYAINQGTVDANSNYSIKNFAAAKLTITKRELVITPTSGLSKFVGELDPPLTFTTSSFYYSDTIQNALTGSLSYSGSTVGSYPITLGGLGAVNYNLTLGATVNFEIKARPATTLTYAEIKGGNIQPAVSASSGGSLTVGSGKKFRLTAGGFTTNIVWSVNGLEVNSVTVSQTSSGCRMEYISGTAVNVDGVTNSCTATAHIKVGTTEVFKLNLIP